VCVLAIVGVGRSDWLLCDAVTSLPSHVVL